MIVKRIQSLRGVLEHRGCEEYVFDNWRGWPSGGGEVDE